jgi:NAD dependent epimerase/dehydratase family enzyme
MKLLITGGSGTLGQKITKLALLKNYQVNILTRNKKLSSNDSGLEYFYWDPSLNIIDDNCFLGVDSIINLSGYNVFCYWSNKNKSKILKSRIESTSFILSQIKEKNIKIKSFVSASELKSQVYDISFLKVLLQKQ